ncbi:hypothetical protein AOG27_21010, partial [Pseudoalteromonas lipolytica]
EGGASAGQVVRGADAGKDTVHRADLRLVCRHEAAGVGEQHDQRCLAHVGGLAAHVGAGDHQHAAVVAHHQVVGHEGSVGDSLHHRVATAADGDARGLGQVRAHELQGAGALGEGAQHVQRRQCPSAGLEGVELGVEGVEESLIEQLLPGECPGLRRQRLVLELLELGDDEALGVLQGLAADIVRRGLLGLGARDLDIV